MSSSDGIVAAIELASVVITVGFCVSTAYRSFSLSKALPGHIYRARAEWIGSFSTILIGATAVEFASASGVFGEFATNFMTGVSAYVSSFLIVFLFAWLSSTIEVSSELDFFHRDTLHWRSLKKFFWLLVVLAAAANILISIIELNPCVGTNCGITAQLESLDGLDAILIVVLILYTLLVLFFTSRRIKDKILKSHIVWLELFTVLVVLALITAGSFPFAILMPVATYFLFRASGFLTPAEKIESIHVEEASVKKGYAVSPSLKYRVIALVFLAFSLFLAGIILHDDGLLKKLAPGNAEAFTSVTIIYGILLVLLGTKVKLGFMLTLLSSSLWLFAQIANVLIPVNQFVTSTNIALFFPHGFASYVLGLSPVHDPTLCPYTCPPLQYSALISLAIQVPLVLSSYLGLRAEKRASVPRAVALSTKTGNSGIP
jgi:hypothetical protein